MKNIFLLISLGLGIAASAQQFVSPGSERLKFSDIVAKYEKAHPKQNDGQNYIAKAILNSMFLNVKEDDNYQFDRWKNYWEQHLDQNGYMVSPTKTWNEWLKVRNKEKNRQAEKTTSSAASWSFVGPDSSQDAGWGVGRINVVAFHPSLSNTYLIGSPGGGVWRTNNNGISWTCLTDQLPLLSVSDIKYNPLNPNTIYLCTGDKDGDDYWSIGILKSTDGGTTWNATGLAWADSTLDLANSLLINPVDTSTLVVGSRWGIYVSHNCGASWSVSLPGYNFKQVLYHPTDTNIIYATSRGTDTSYAQIYRSGDGGTTWTVMTSFTNTVRITLAVTPANPSIVEAIAASSDASNLFGLDNIYISTDTGYTYSIIYGGGCSSNPLFNNPSGAGCGGQGEYDLTIAIDPANQNNVYIGGVNAWQSYDGGNSWSILSQWSDFGIGAPVVHGDKHFMGFHPLVPGRFFECNDGGIFWIDNPSSTGTWYDITNHLGIEEIYRVAVSNLATFELSGAQDNGTKYTQYGTFYQALGGDGMQCQIDPMDSNTYYASWQYGNIESFGLSGANYISNNIPPYPPTGGWITPFVIKPSDHYSLFAGYQNVWETNDQGTSWNAVSSALTATDLLRVATSYSDANTLYAAEDNSNNLFYSHNINLGSSATWTTVSVPDTGAKISDIKVDQFNNTKAWVTFSGYGSPEVASYSPSAGWTYLNAGLPDVPVNCIIIDTSNRIKYVGTDIGVYYMDTTMTSWMPFNTGLPVIRVCDLQIDYYTGKLWAATYGRSLWVSPKQPAHPVTTDIVPLATDYLSIAPNPSNGDFRVLFGSAVTEKIVDANLINTDGKVTWQGSLPVTGNSIQFSNLSLSRGIYILTINGASGTIGKKKIEIN